MVQDIVNDAVKYEKLRLKRNEYARHYRERNKTTVIDDESEEKRIALNLKAKLYRDRKNEKKKRDASACTGGGVTQNASPYTISTAGISEHIQLLCTLICVCFALVFFIFILFRPPSHPID